MSELSLTSFLTLFEYTDIKVVERFDELLISFKPTDNKKPEFSAFEEAIKFLNPRDELYISYIVDGGEPIDFNFKDDIEDFLSILESKLSIIEDEEVEVVIRILKHCIDGVVSLYSYKDFLTYLEGLSIQALFHEFNYYILKARYLIFESQDVEPITKTKSIWFVNKGFAGLPEQMDRSSFINKAKTSCHYNFLATFELVADDFFVLSTDGEKLGSLFNKLSIVSSIVFLYDITAIKKNHLEYRLNGYKSITGDADLSKIEADPENQYYRIYSWVYDSGNFNDKIGLARNIVSLHLENPNHIELRGNPFQSIQSSYKVYEKQNIKQYIEIRNKISDQLLSFHDRANKIIETFASGFQKSALALITFYISAIIIKVLNKNQLTEVFTLDASVLSTAFVLCSLVYFFISRWEIRAQKKRFNNNYDDVKKRYTDLLDEQDINRILNHDHEFKSDLAFITAKGKAYSIMWISFLAIFFVTTWLLYFIYNPAFLSNIIGWISENWNIK